METWHITDGNLMVAVLCEAYGEWENSVVKWFDKADKSIAFLLEDGYQVSFVHFLWNGHMPGDSVKRYWEDHAVWLQKQQGFFPPISS